MKFITRSFLFRLHLVVLLFVLLVLSCLPTMAQTRLTPMFVTNLIGFPAVNGQITAAGNSNITSGTFTNQPIVVNPGYAVGLSALWTNAAGAATNLGVFLNVSPDGTNWPSPPGNQYYVQFGPKAANGFKWISTNMPATLFDGFMQFRVESVTNCDTANTVSNIQIEITRRRLDYQ